MMDKQLNALAQKVGQGQGAVKESIQVPQYVSNARLASIRNKARLNHPLTLTEQKILDNNQGIRI